MARRTADLQRLTPQDVEALVVPPKKRGDDGGHGEGEEAPTAGRAEAPAETVFVLFDRGTADDARIARALAAVAERHRGRVGAATAAAEPLLPRLQQWQDARRAYDTFDFRRWPAVGVFRAGRLITTFHPRHVFFADDLQEREEREQLEIFLSKMVYFDPAQVKEQKSLELEAEA